MAANPNDGTALGTGEVISAEYIDPVLGSRADNDLPPTAYKLPRSKIAIGSYGQDAGDATADTPLQVESRNARQSDELQSMRERQWSMQQMSRFSGEIVSLIDSRGEHMTSRGQR